MTINEKKELLYSKHKYGFYNIIIKNGSNQDEHIRVYSWKSLLKLFSKSKYNYINVEKLGGFKNENECQ